MVAMPNPEKPVRNISRAVFYLAGDSGDGLQLMGDLCTNTAAFAGEFFATLPDYPSEIRAPSGTVYGVSGFQICFGGEEVFTPGDDYDLLLALNPAALKAKVGGVKPEGYVLVNEDAFVAKALEKAGYATNPLDSGELSRFRVLRVPMHQKIKEALEGMPLSTREAERCKNFFALGLIYWLYGRDPSSTREWIAEKFRAKPQFVEANTKVLEAGMRFAAESEIFRESHRIQKMQGREKAGTYRNVTGNQATALGLMAASRKAGLKLFLGSYPITPATDILQELSRYRDYATVLQAEDEIAAIGAAIGAAFGGALAATSTSGPGFSLKAEFMNLAVMTELPLVIIDVQRAGPSTGLPTKTEQSDMMQALWGRHGESPLVVMAASSPKECFDVAVEASRIALKYMTPVVMLSEGYLGNGSEAWRIPALEELPEIPVRFHQDPATFQPYARDPDTLARPWAVPGTPGLEHRIGGLEKEDVSGKVSHDPHNHEKMVELREEKVRRVAREIGPLEVFGHAQAELLVLSWGGTAGAVKDAVRRLSADGIKVACGQLRYLNPLPPDLGERLRGYKKVLVPELNRGQLAYRLRAEFLTETVPMNKVQGQPFRVDEIETKIRSILGV